MPAIHYLCRSHQPGSDMKYFLFASLSFLFFSCSKNNPSGGTPTAQDSTCQLISVKWVYNNILYTTNLTYNSDGKLAKRDDGLGNSTSYTYSDDQVFIKNDTSTSIRDTTTLNNFGYTAQFNVNAPPVLSSSVFYYVSDTILDHSIFTSPLIASPDTTVYIFTNGDLTTMVAGGTTYTYTYYTDQAEQPADFAIYNQIIAEGALAYKNKHLTKSYSGNSFSSTYTYSFDASGKIVSIADNYTNSQSSGTVTYYYSYACHL